MPSDKRKRSIDKSQGEYSETKHPNGLTAEPLSAPLNASGVRFEALLAYE